MRDVEDFFTSIEEIDNDKTEPKPPQKFLSEPRTETIVIDSNTGQEITLTTF